MRGPGQHAESSHCGIARLSVEELERRPNPVGIEQRSLTPHPGSNLGESQQDTAAVGTVLFPENQAEPDKTGELDRDGGGGDAEPAGELTRRNRSGWIEMFENAGQMIGEAPARGLIPNAPAAPGGVKGRISRQHGVHLGVEHSANYRI